MIRQVETWKAFVVKNQAHYNKTNEMIDNLEKNVGELERKVNY